MELGSTGIKLLERWIIWVLPENTDPRFAPRNVVKDFTDHRLRQQIVPKVSNVRTECA